MQHQHYSRTSPSPEYLRLANLYQQHHASKPKKGWGNQTTYPGRSLWPHLGFIKALIKKHSAKTILDYGAGKGYQYTDLRVKDAGKLKIYSSVETYWGAKVTCYDPGNPIFSMWPEGHFGGVISTDVLEHCPAADMEWIIREMFEKATVFVFANIACYPARTILPSGENAHSTIQPPEWWKKLIEKIAKDFPDISYYFLATVDRSQPGELITNNHEKLVVPKAGALSGNLFKACWSLIKQKVL